MVVELEQGSGFRFLAWLLKEMAEVGTTEWASGPITAWVI